MTLPRRFRHEAADGFSADFALDIDGDVYRVAIARGRCTVRPEDPAFPSARISTDRDTWLALDAGEMSSIDAFLQDRLQVRGNVEYAVRMQSLFHLSGRRRTAQDLEHRAVRVGRHVLSSYAFGQGSPVVLLHGLGGHEALLPPPPPRAGPGAPGDRPGPPGPRRVDEVPGGLHAGLLR